MYCIVIISIVKVVTSLSCYISFCCIVIWESCSSSFTRGLAFRWIKLPAGSCKGHGFAARLTAGTEDWRWACLSGGVDASRDTDGSGENVAAGWISAPPRAVVYRVLSPGCPPKRLSAGTR